MKFALCTIPFFAITVSFAQQPNQTPLRRAYVVTEAQTISVQELQQRSQAKALETFRKGKILARQGDHAGAIKAFDKVLEKDPLFSDARNDLAVELIVSGQEARAIDELEHLVKLDPGFTVGYTNLGVVLCFQKRFAEAEDSLRRALTVNPNSPKANLLFAIALKGQGKLGAETRNALEVAAKSSPTANKLLKEWFRAPDAPDVADVADSHPPQN